ncbi:hypothetical protein [uncultured Pseudokineococcus sp.]|uniref:hypothetical protein n=1 Tax=uncultured Pseudokineococcus sp. TaxID=1642928 RepID=UPI002604D796|nr:hypothetical protein [uncultured Pseudokineococcus sp.]
MTPPQPPDEPPRPAPDGWTAVWARPGPAAPTSPPGGTAAPAGPDGTTAWGAAPPPRPPRPAWRWVVGAAVLLAVVVGGAALAVTGARAAWDALGDGSFFGLEEGERYGDNPVLDALWDDCEAGDGLACDDLFDSSGFGTAYETFGLTCGKRFTEASAPEWCEDELDGATRVRDDARPADDAVLDRLRDGCAEGDGVDCDELYALAEEGSDDERFGVTCGERYSELRAPDFCAEALG